MLQFVKKWYQAFKEDKAVRLAKDQKLDSPLRASIHNEAKAWSKAAAKALHDERMREDYY